MTLARHVATGLGTLPEDLRAELTVIVVVLFALVGTLLTEVGTDRREVAAVVGAPSHEAGVKRRHVRDVTTQADTFGHPLARPY